MVNNLNYDGVGFPGWEKDFSKMEKKNNTCINKLIFPTCVSDQKFDSQLMVINRIMCISMTLTDLCFTKTKNTWALMVHNLYDDKKEQFSLKIISNKYQFYLKFMPILSIT